MRRFRVVTRITQFIEAESPEDAAKYMDEMLQHNEVSLEKDGETVVRFSRRDDVTYKEAPEDISKTRNPAEKPRPQDWVEVEEHGMKTIALVTRLTKRRIYYLDGLTRQERSMDKDEWLDWSQRHTLHPRYEHQLPPFIVGEAMDAHRKKGLLGEGLAQTDSSIILAVLEKYGYTPNDYEMKNGYWAENEMEKAISRHILQKSEEDEKEQLRKAIAESTPKPAGPVLTGTSAAAGAVAGAAAANAAGDNDSSAEAQPGEEQQKVASAQGEEDDGIEDFSDLPEVPDLSW